MHRRFLVNISKMTYPTCLQTASATKLLAPPWQYKMEDRHSTPERDQKGGRRHGRCRSGEDRPQGFVLG